MPASYSHLATMVMALSYKEAYIDIPKPLLDAYIGEMVMYLNHMDSVDNYQGETILACESLKRVYKQRDKQNHINENELPKVLSYSDTQILR